MGGSVHINTRKERSRVRFSFAMIGAFDRGFCRSRPAHGWNLAVPAAKPQASVIHAPCRRRRGWSGSGWWRCAGWAPVEHRGDVAAGCGARGAAVGERSWVRVPSPAPCTTKPHRLLAGGASCVWHSRYPKRCRVGTRRGCRRSVRHVHALLDMLEIRHDGDRHHHQQRP